MTFRFNSNNNNNNLLFYVVLAIETNANFLRKVFCKINADFLGFSATETRRNDVLLQRSPAVVTTTKSRCTRRTSMIVSKSPKNTYTVALYNRPTHVRTNGNGGEISTGSRRPVLGVRYASAPPLIRRLSNKAPIGVNWQPKPNGARSFTGA